MTTFFEHCTGPFVHALHTVSFNQYEGNRKPLVLPLHLQTKKQAESLGSLAKAAQLINMGPKCWETPLAFHIMQMTQILFYQQWVLSSLPTNIFLYLETKRKCLNPSLPFKSFPTLFKK